MCLVIFYVSVMFAMKDIPVFSSHCFDACMEVPERKSSLTTKNTCFCVVCAEALTKPETLKSLGCLSLKVGYDRVLKKHYGQPGGRYYYC